MSRNPLARAASAAGRLSKFALGRYVELIGDRMRVEGLTLSLDSPAIHTSQKGELYFGHHELEERDLVKRWLPKGLPVVEFGGGIGLVSCLINRALDRPGDHVVVEANPNLLQVLERNRDLNGCKFRVVSKAIAYEMETVELGLGWHFAGTSVGAGNHVRATTRVPATTLREVVDAAGFDQISLVSDIEGIEVSMIEREIDVLRRHVRFFLAEFHPGNVGEEAFRRSLESLEAAGFVQREEMRLKPTDVNTTYVFTRD